MIKMIYKAFAKNLFGAKFERLTQSLFLSLILYWGLHIAETKIQIAPSIFYLMVSTFSAGVMWQALSSENTASLMQNILMLPFTNRAFIFSYVAALGTYTFFTKTAILLAVLLAFSVWSAAEIFAGILCILHAILLTAALYSIKKYWYFAGLWAVSVLAAALFLANKPYFIPFLLLHGTLAAILLRTTDSYAFYLPEGKTIHTRKNHPHHSIGRYFFRYLLYHKNYLFNMAVMWCVACVLPLFFKQIDSSFVPIVFAILSLNTPICILLSCDPSFEQAIRSLPGQRNTFCAPYCLFLFSCNLIANVIFLCSLQITYGSVSIWMILTAAYFALQSAIFSVLLEWFYPIRHWKIESDLWHHPRKYIVPTAMLLLAGLIGTLPKLLPVFLLLLAVEIAIFHSLCQR